jgi:oligopeptide/dipeptide ABC transporter ATP-binding protein
VSEPLLRVEGLTTTVFTANTRSEVLHNVGFSLSRGEILGIVGESGSGKSMTAKSIIRLLPEGAESTGHVYLNGRDLLTLGQAALRHVRSTQTAMIFQDPRASVNPVVRCGAQIVEALRISRHLSKPAASAEAARLLTMLRITEPLRVIRAYPHELSGGMLQRVLIAIALAMTPQLLIADEATTALDVTVQADIVATLDDLRQTEEVAVIFITHDLDLAAAFCSRILVMYAGRIVEEQTTGGLYAAPRHPYTVGLLGARPQILERQLRLAAIPGRPPDLGAEAFGCAFAPRCPHADSTCRDVLPPLELISSGGRVACHKPRAYGR